jgi:hypothetical protein
MRKLSDVTTPPRNMPAANTRHGYVLIPTTWVALASIATDPHALDSDRLNAGATLGSMVLDASEMPR